LVIPVFASLVSYQALTFIRTARDVLYPPLSDEVQLWLVALLLSLLNISPFLCAWMKSARGLSRKRKDRDDDRHHLDEAPGVGAVSWPLLVSVFFSILLVLGFGTMPIQHAKRAIFPRYMPYSWLKVGPTEVDTGTTGWRYEFVQDNIVTIDLTIDELSQESVYGSIPISLSNPARQTGSPDDWVVIQVQRMLILPAGDPNKAIYLKSGQFHGRWSFHTFSGIMAVRTVQAPTKPTAKRDRHRCYILNEETQGSIYRQPLWQSMWCLFQVYWLRLDVFDALSKDLSQAITPPRSLPFSRDAEVLRTRLLEMTETTKPRMIWLKKS